MGVRLHSAKKYEVVYSNKASFNYSNEYINPIISVLSEHTLYWEGDFLSDAVVLECERNILLENIDKIITPDDDWYYQDELNGEIDRMLKYNTSNITRESLYNDLKSIILESDKNDSTIHFHWF